MISIFNTETQTKEGLIYNQFNLIQEFKNINTPSDLSGGIYPVTLLIDDYEYVFDLSGACLLPDKLGDISDNCWYNNINLHDGIEINKKVFLSVINKMLPCIYDYSKEKAKNNPYIPKPVTDFHLLRIYYVTISSFTQIWNLFYRIFKNEIKNKLIVLGPGNFMEQCIPQFVINDILSTNKVYDIYLIDPCDEGWGCPTIDLLIGYLRSKLGDNYDEKISNFKITHLSLTIELYPLFYTIYCLNEPDMKTIIYDTIGTGHKGSEELNKYNLILNSLQKITNNDFINLLISKNIVAYMGSGPKFIYFNNKDKNFKLEGTNNLKNCSTSGGALRDCPLSKFPIDCILNNNFDDFDFKPYKTSEGGYYNKYMKYKLKYLKLKSTLTK